ncbi:MAG: surface-adhesin E family protein [Nitrospiraceae bacterium]
MAVNIRPHRPSSTRCGVARAVGSFPALGAVHLLAFTEFSGHMSTGGSADGHVDSNAWLPVQPKTIHQALWEIACAGM